MKRAIAWLGQRLNDSLPKQRWGAVTVAILTLAAATMLVASYFLPYWQMELDAPQIPDNLILAVYLHGVEGDVYEIDIWNKSIGMKPIETAAQLERQLSIYGLVLIAVLLVVSLFAGRFANWLKVPALLFPAFFFIMIAYFLYDYGHDLDPRAPITIEPFMPGLFGERGIAMFKTYSTFEAGFYLALGAAALLLIAIVVQRFSGARSGGRDVERGRAAERTLKREEVRT